MLYFIGLLLSGSALAAPLSGHLGRSESNLPPVPHRAPDSDLDGPLNATHGARNLTLACQDPVKWPNASLIPSFDGGHNFTQVINATLVRMSIH